MIRHVILSPRHDNVILLPKVCNICLSKFTCVSAFSLFYISDKFLCSMMLRIYIAFMTIFMSFESSQCEDVICDNDCKVAMKFEQLENQLQQVLDLNKQLQQQASIHTDQISGLISKVHALERPIRKFLARETIIWSCNKCRISPCSWTKYLFQR